MRYTAAPNCLGKSLGWLASVYRPLAKQQRRALQTHDDVSFLRPPRPRAPTRRLPSELKSHFGPIARRHHACICEDEQTRSCASVLRINCVSNYSSKSAAAEPPVELWRHPVGGSCSKSRRARAPHDCPATAQCTLLERRAASPPLRHILN